MGATVAEAGTVALVLVSVEVWVWVGAFEVVWLIEDLLMVEQAKSEVANIVTVLVEFDQLLEPGEEQAEMVEYLAETSKAVEWDLELFVMSVGSVLYCLYVCQVDYLW
jgi:hypothetical protein